MCTANWYTFKEMKYARTHKIPEMELWALVLQSRDFCVFGLQNKKAAKKRRNDTDQSFAIKRGSDIN